MPRTQTPPTELDNFGDVLERVGDVAPQRILLKPAPGTATEQDLLRLLDGPKKRLCELIDGVLVEKIMGSPEAHIALVLGRYLDTFLDEHDLGAAFGADGPFKLRERVVRLPDVSVITWKRLRKKKIPKDAIIEAAPELAVEVVSKHNTKSEIRRKLDDYFDAGVLLVWVIYPKTRTAKVHTSTTTEVALPATGALDGAEVLPGFSLPLKKLFARLEP